jgi:hypothetical protein
LKSVLFAQHTVCLVIETLFLSLLCLTWTQALIETRGTNEPQGPSNSFKTMDAAIIAQVMGGTEVCIPQSAASEEY